ncbi:MAG: HlyC/CorC family transporter [Clostridia bacterium]|nr:HlyC/CorC family transporter [Clostridia bacterium]
MDTDGNIRSILSAAGGTGSGLSDIGGLLLLFIFFVICGAYFGGAESAFSAVNKIRVKSKAEDGNRQAKHAMTVLSDFDRALTTLLVGNNLTHIAAASVATVIFARLFGTDDSVTVLCTLLTTGIIFLFSEMIPKSFANDRPETAALFSAKPLTVLMKILSPVVWFFSLVSKAATGLLSKLFHPSKEPSITEEELYDIIDTVEEEGVVNEEQGKLIKSALDFSDTCVKDVMTMRTDIEAIDRSMSNADILAFLRGTSHTRVPVCDGDLDHIVGVLQMRVFIREYLKHPDLNLSSVLLPVYFVSPEARIDDLLSEMRQHKMYLSVVSDEEGKTLGIVTIEDFLEELVGEIWDEDDVVDRNFVKLGGNRFSVNTHLSVREICERLGCPVVSIKDADRPLLSILLTQFGRMPEEEDECTWCGWDLTVEQVRDGRVDTVVLRLPLPSDSETEVES